MAMVVSLPTLVSLESFDSSLDCVLLSSPRSLEAVRVVNIDPTLLLKRPLEFFKQGADKDEVAVRKHQKYEKRRRTLVRLCTEKRSEIIDIEAKMAERDEASLSSYMREFRAFEEARELRAVKRELQQVVAVKLQSKRTEELMDQGDVKLKKKEADKAEYLAGHADRERVRAEGLAEARREQEEEEKRLYNVFLAKVEASERAEEEKRRKKAVAEAKRQEEATEHKAKVAERMSSTHQKERDHRDRMREKSEKTDKEASQRKQQMEGERQQAIEEGKERTRKKQEVIEHLKLENMQKTLLVERALEERDGVVQARLDQKEAAHATAQESRLVQQQRRRAKIGEVRREQEEEVEQRAVEMAKKLKASEEREVLLVEAHERMLEDKKVAEELGAEERQNALIQLEKIANYEADKNHRKKDEVQQRMAYNKEKQRRIVEIKADVIKQMQRERERVLGQAMGAVQRMALLENEATADPRVDFHKVSESILAECGLRDAPLLPGPPPTSPNKHRIPALRLKHKSLPHSLPRRSKPLASSQSLKALQRTHKIYGAVDMGGFSAMDFGGPGNLNSSLNRGPLFQSRGEKVGEGVRASSAPRREKGAEVVPALSEKEAETMVEDIAAQQNAVLVGLLEKEKVAERSRQEALAAMAPEERKVKELEFQAQRKKAMDMVKAITHEHQTALVLKMEELGFAATPPNVDSLIDRAKQRSLSPISQKPAAVKS